MGFVREEVAEENQSVDGLIIALEDDVKLRWALSSVPAVRFMRYEISFRLFQS
jgi:restriction system protein